MLVRFAETAGIVERIGGTFVLVEGCNDRGQMLLGLGVRKSGCVFPRAVCCLNE